MNNIINPKDLRPGMIFSRPRSENDKLPMWKIGCWLCISNVDGVIWFMYYTALKKELITRIDCFHIDSCDTNFDIHITLCRHIQC